MQLCRMRDSRPAVRFQKERGFPKRGIDLSKEMTNIFGLRGVNVALWEADGTTEIESNRYVSDNDNVTVGSVDLSAGNWYYISVDNHYSGYRGTFTLCLNDDVDYDYYDGAQIITNLDNWSSVNAAYTTVGESGITPLRGPKIQITCGQKRHY